MTSVCTRHTTTHHNTKTPATTRPKSHRCSSHDNKQKNRINKKTWVQWQQNQQYNNNECSSNIGSWKLSPSLIQQKGAEELESSSTFRSKYNTSPNKTVNQLVKNLACAVLIIKECQSGEKSLQNALLWAVVIIPRSAGQRSGLWHMADMCTNTSASVSVRRTRLNFFLLFAYFNKNVSKEEDRRERANRLPQSSSS